jgi:PUA domain protein
LKIVVLSKSETTDIISRMKQSWPDGTVPKIKNFKLCQIDDHKSLLIGDELTAVQIGEKIIPFLDQSEVLSKFPTIIVDMGAIKFVCNGARVARPGIVEMDSFGKGDIVTVRDQVHHKILAVGTALEDSQTANHMTKGHVVENLHYISDKIWETSKTVQPKHS